MDKRNSQKSFRTLEIAAVTLAVALSVAVFFFWHPSAPVGGEQAGVDIKISSPATYTEPMTLKSEGKTFSISALGANPAQAVTVGAVTKYTDAFTNTDVTETKQSDRMKEDIILKQPGHPATFAYQIDVAPYDVVKDSEGSLVFYMKGHSGESSFWRFEIPAPFMIDASGKKSTVSDVESTLTSDGILTVRPSTAWLATAAYPVDLDPTIIFFRAGIAPAPPAPDTTTYIEDVFSAYTYTGNGSTQTITNGIDLAGKGGLVWTKNRVSAYGHLLVNTLGSVDNYMWTNATNAETGGGGALLTSVNSTGYAIAGGGAVNEDTSKLVSWSFAQANKFFKVAQVTVSGGADATVDLSSLGTVGMVTVKRTDSTSAWFTWHRSLTSGKLVYLNTTAAETTDGSITVSGTTLTLEGGVIADGTYIVYAWAHDTGTDGLIQCGTFTPSAGLATVELGWEPQYLIIKPTTGANYWYVVDTMRGWANGSNDVALKIQASDAEGGVAIGHPTSTGFYVENGQASAYIYCAIRRGPMKQATSGTQVYTSIAGGYGMDGLGNYLSTGTILNNATDVIFSKPQDSTVGWQIHDRLRGPLVYLRSNTTAAEASDANSISAFSPAYNRGPKFVSESWEQILGVSNAHWLFRRYPGVFDEVAYTGNGTTQNITHNLGVVPELMIVKGRSGATDWQVYHQSTGRLQYTVLNTTAASIDGYTRWNTTTPTATVFTVGTSSLVNTSAATYVAYLFATKAGISKVGSYTGNGTSLTLNAGFTGGAKFILIKRTDSTGDWYVWDSTRGIVAGNDPHLSLNTTSAEVTTDDSIDPDNSGFIVNQVAATNINVNAATYIYLAFSGDTPPPAYTPPTRTVPTIFRASANSPTIFRAPITLGVPGAPTIGTATQTGATTATVSFSTPASNGGATITTYTAYPSSGAGTGTLSQAGSGTINVTGLTALTSYTFTVTATNSVGQGPASAASNSITMFSCGSSTVTGLDSLTYGTVTGADGKCWFATNLGTTNVGTSYSDSTSYGSLYQWGRLRDLHQATAWDNIGTLSGTTGTQSAGDVPGNANFIIGFANWRSTQNDNLWGDASKTNNVCPAGWHVPTQLQWATWTNAAGLTSGAGAGTNGTQLCSGGSGCLAAAYATNLKLPSAGSRYGSNGSLYNQGAYGYYWSSSPSGSYASDLLFYASGVFPAYAGNRAYGFSVRCLQDP